MAYRELIKSFGRIRTYMRSFYVFGFRHRREFDEKSARSYDNERRRVESWLGDYMSFGQDEDGRRVFLSVDSRAVDSNPLYQAFRAKSFTDRDIMLHFHLLDLLTDPAGLTLAEMMEALDRRLNTFDEAALPDESTVRKKLSEYETLGLVAKTKSTRQSLWRRTLTPIDPERWQDALAFFAEAAPLGVIGSFVRDLLPEQTSFFRFKHHYLLNALDSEILCALADAMSGERLVWLTKNSRRTQVLPLRLYISTQTGRQYLLSASPKGQHFSFWRLDQISSVRAGEPAQAPPELWERLKAFQSHIWGVSASRSDRLEHLEMTVFAGEGEEYIVQRLEREKRCGRVEQIDQTHWRFSIDACDTLEMMPWVRSFFGRITAFEAENPEVRERFFRDLEAMSALYGGEGHAVP